MEKQQKAGTEETGKKKQKQKTVKVKKKSSGKKHVIKVNREIRKIEKKIARGGGKRGRRSLEMHISSTLKPQLEASKKKLLEHQMGGSVPATKK